MSFSSLLSEIKNKTKNSESKPSYTYNPNVQKKGNTSQTTTSKPSSSYAPQRTIDPAVQRLKELRRLENAKKEALNPKPKTQRARASTSSTVKAAPARRRRTPEVSIKQSALQERPRSSSPQKRLTFAELMSHAQEKSKTLASKEDQPQATAQPKYTPKTQPKATQPRGQRTSSAPSSASGIRRPPSATSSARRSPNPASRPSSRPTEPVPSRPKFAQPSAKLQAKLDAKRKRQQERKSKSTTYGYEEDSYESDFIVDDEEEQEEEGDYDRDEIWKMFNRGKSRSDYVDYDDDLSDMEATGSEVLNEELRSAKRAKLEERAEAERERRRVEEKRRRLGKK